MFFCCKLRLHSNSASCYLQMCHVVMSLTENGRENPTVPLRLPTLAEESCQPHSFFCAHVVSVPFSAPLSLRGNFFELLPDVNQFNVFVLVLVHFYLPPSFLDGEAYVVTLNSYVHGPLVVFAFIVDLADARREPGSR